MKNLRWHKVLFLAVVAASAASCKHTEYLTAVRHTTDTLVMVRDVRDSIHLHDSIFVNQFQRGETIFVEKERWHTRYRDRLLIDTFYVSRMDSVPVVIGTPQTRQPTLWQLTLKHYGDVLLLIMLGIVVYVALMIRRLFL